ncbi:MAG: porphobilinogen synthase, partial [Pseudomonadota bacterium]
MSQGFRSMSVTPPAFPRARTRRTRRTPALRALVREERLSADDLIWPVFVCDGDATTQEVASMPGVIRRSVDLTVEAAAEALAQGIRTICLFPYTDPALKTDLCEEAWNPENLSNRAIRAIKREVP